MICNECNHQFYRCDQCGTDINASDKILCCENGLHFCSKKCAQQLWWEMVGESINKQTYATREATP